MTWWRRAKRFIPGLAINPFLRFLRIDVLSAKDARKNAPLERTMKNRMEPRCLTQLVAGDALFVWDHARSELFHSKTIL